MAHFRGQLNTFTLMLQPHLKVYQDDAVQVHARIGKLEVGEGWIAILSATLAHCDTDALDDP